MKRPRFTVATCSGFLDDAPRRRAGSPGLSAYVVDNFYNGKVVATFRSEEAGRGRILGRRGRAYAVAAAEQRAQQLNASYA
jgi:hypothetical protein